VFNLRECTWCCSIIENCNTHMSSTDYGNPFIGSHSQLIKGNETLWSMSSVYIVEIKWRLQSVQWRAGTWKRFHSLDESSYLPPKLRQKSICSMICNIESKFPKLLPPHAMYFLCSYLLCVKWIHVKCRWQKRRKKEYKNVKVMGFLIIFFYS
jgi:hypothetical protein